MDVWDEPLHEPGVVTVTLPGVVRQVEAGEAEPVVEARRQHAGQVAEAARGQVEAAQPTASVVTKYSNFLTIRSIYIFGHFSRTKDM